MGKMKIFACCFLLLLVACGGVAYQDKYYQLDNVQGHELRGDKPEHDLPLSDCEPIDGSDGKKQYRCVVHKYGDYDKILNYVALLENELRSCQQGQVKH